MIPFSQFVPPVALRVLERIRPGHVRGCDSFAQAMARCGTGYQEEELVDIVFRKTLEYIRLMDSPASADINWSALRLLPGLEARKYRSTVNVVDFGGGCGSHYFTLRKVIGRGTGIRWYVVETETMARKAKALEDGAIRFFSSIEDAVAAAGRVDVLFSSGALQYTPDPSATLRHLIAKTEADEIRLTRVGLVEGNAGIACVQESRLCDNGPGLPSADMSTRMIRYPMMIDGRSRLESVLAESSSVSYHLLEEREGGQIRGRPLQMHGYLAHRSPGSAPAR